jgi:hypothetical protein
MTQQDLVRRFIIQFRRPFNQKLVCEMTDAPLEIVNAVMSTMLAEGNIKRICKEEEIYVYAYRYDFKLVNTHSQKLDFSKMECGKLLNIISHQKIHSIRQLASIYGRSRQWIYLYLEAMASVKVIGIDQNGYCVLDPQKIPLVGSIVIKGILGELRGKAGIPSKQRAPYRTKKRMDQQPQQALQDKPIRGLL